jgi:hypothetical protein
MAGEEYRVMEWRWKCNISEGPGFRFVGIHSARLDYSSKLKKK